MDTEVEAGSLRRPHPALAVVLLAAAAYTLRTR
jgi:hypothetical protein